MKKSFPKTDTASLPVSPSTARTNKLTKPAKVPSWSFDMTMETYTKQLETWSEINDEAPEFMKYHDFMESLKQNKDIKDLTRYMVEHILPVLEKKQHQTIKRGLKLLEVSRGPI